MRVNNPRSMRWVGHVACMDQMGYLYKILVRIPEGKRPCGRPRHRWEDYIKRDLRGKRLESFGLDSCGSGLGPLAGYCEYGNETLGIIEG
jgi:hypothetical protein